MAGSRYRRHLAARRGARVRARIRRRATGALALVAAVVAAFVYPGMWDKPLGDSTHLGAGSAHVIGMLLFAAIAYILVLYLGSLLNRVARLPVLGQINKLLGAVIGLAWAAVFVWVVLFVALYFPLSKDLRSDLGRSALVRVFETPERDRSTRSSRSHCPGSPSRSRTESSAATAFKANMFCVILAKARRRFLDFHPR